MVLDQVGILVTGVIAVWLTQHKRESWRRWACIFAAGAAILVLCGVEG